MIIIKPKNPKAWRNLGEVLFWSWTALGWITLLSLWVGNSYSTTTDGDGMPDFKEHSSYFNGPLHHHLVLGFILWLGPVVALGAQQLFSRLFTIKVENPLERARRLEKSPR